MYLDNKVEIAGYAVLDGTPIEGHPESVGNYLAVVTAIEGSGYTGTVACEFTVHDEYGGN